MEVKEFVRQVDEIAWQLRTFEDRYGVRSEDCYKAVETGELVDFDDIDDPRFHDFPEWHSLEKAQRWQAQQLPALNNARQPL